MSKAAVVSLCMFLFVTLNCDKVTESQESLPRWLDVKIAQFQSEAVTNPPRAIVSYKYNSTVVYYVPPVCCDQYGIVYSGTGDTLCFPDGGESGHGDGRCSDFFQAASDSSLIWKDSRN